jgi:hypothetical protein
MTLDCSGQVDPQAEPAQDRTAWHPSAGCMTPRQLQSPHLPVVLPHIHNTHIHNTQRTHTKHTYNTHTTHTTYIHTQKPHTTRKHDTQHTYTTHTCTTQKTYTYTHNTHTTHTQHTDMTHNTHTDTHTYLSRPEPALSKVLQTISTRQSFPQAPAPCLTI